MAGAEAVDTALLLIPLMGFLPARHPRVCSTVKRVVDDLSINGFLHRFLPERLPGQGTCVLGQEEGAFFMCSFWLARWLAATDEVAECDAILAHAKSIAGELRLFSEAVDARSSGFLGNMPLLFSQVEYANAILAVRAARARRQRPGRSKRGRWRSMQAVADQHSARK